MDAATQMVVDGSRAFAMIGAVLWTMLRIGAMFTVMPLVGTKAVPGRVRVILSGTLAIALAPMLPPVPDWDGFNAAVVLSVARELAVGASMGFMLRLIFEAGAMAGELVSQSTGLGFAQMADPLRGVNSGVLGQWFYLAFGLMFFTANGHLAVVSLLVDSYKALPIGTALPDAQAMASVAPNFFMSMMRGAVTLALPVMVAMMAVNLAFGALAKAAPSLNPIQLGLPVAVVLGLALLALLVGEMGPPVQRLFDSAFDAARALTA
ncbi:MULTISPECIES: flagellar biosynthetic protein FliR [Xanthomonas]|uniref:flagellar biosynthetic protein FliR n=1 Tax=Xanthomonas TaxID=338 RepID=UPI00137087A5|nr:MULTISPECIES: flagellar biosynthetic protein FliR [Xanthomonas]MCI2246349.1 flagellar biosynthetic protein FliR [Xanthomonas indica]MXV33398.1 flagellar biosynthetic protein FliR [Xanthomonas sp. LMG 8989]UYC10280.1 flagellar biosynthetic protein FliR [Xanthomonas sp. CFBP 8445]